MAIQQHDSEYMMQRAVNDADPQPDPENNPRCLEVIHDFEFKLCMSLPVRACYHAMLRRPSMPLHKGLELLGGGGCCGKNYLSISWFVTGSACEKYFILSKNLDRVYTKRTSHA